MEYNTAHRSKVEYCPKMEYHSECLYKRVKKVIEVAKDIMSEMERKSLFALCALCFFLAPDIQSCSKLPELLQQSFALIIIYMSRSDYDVHANIEVVSQRFAEG